MVRVGNNSQVQRPAGLYPTGWLVAASSPSGSATRRAWEFHPDPALDAGGGVRAPRPQHPVCVPGGHCGLRVARSDTPHRGRRGRRSGRRRPDRRPVAEGARHRGRQWRPDSNEESPIRINPEVRFGEPAIDGITTSAIAEQFVSGEEESEIAAIFDLTERDVKWALAYELANQAA